MFRDLIHWTQFQSNNVYKKDFKTLKKLHACVLFRLLSLFDYCQDFENSFDNNRITTVLTPKKNK